MTLIHWPSSSSSSSRDEYYLGGTIALLLQDHRMTILCIMPKTHTEAM